MPFQEKVPECRNLLAELSETIDDESVIESCNVTQDCEKDNDPLSKEMEHIKVYLRIRPLTADEHAHGMDNSCISIESDRTVIVSAPRMSHAFRSSNYGLSRQRQRFTFTHVFPPDTSQKQFYDGTVQSMVAEFVSGQNCLIFTYGVTNSGKTYTIQGDSKCNAGILPRSLDAIFSRISGRQCTDMSLKPVKFGDVGRLNEGQIKAEKKLKQCILRGSTSNTSVRDSDESRTANEKKALSDASESDMDTDAGNNARVSQALSEDSLDCHPSVIPGSSSTIPQPEESRIRYVLWASFAEIYNEQIFDLLDSAADLAARSTRPPALQLRDDQDGRPYIRGLNEVQVSSAEEASRLLQIGRENQHIASTRLNRASSRGHSIFTLRLVQVVDVEVPGNARIASFSFCDLAGSERHTATTGFNDRIKEAGNINSSLLTLGRCIEALRRNQARRDNLSAPRASIVPFRESKLTRLFQNFLCGEGRVVMIINVSQCSNVFDETLHAVKYSALARQVITGPVACPLFSLTVPENRKVSGAVKAETGKAGTKRKLKESTSSTDEGKAAGVVQNTRNQPTAHGDIPYESEGSESEYSDEDGEQPWKEEREKLRTVIKQLHSVNKQLQSALAEERQTKAAMETEIRAEVCQEMEKQLVRVEAQHQEQIQRREEIWEEKYDRKMEIYMEAVQKSCKRQRRERPADDHDEYVSSVELHAAEVKLSRCTEELNELKSENAELQKKLATAVNNVSRLSADRNSIAEKLSKLEFAGSDYQMQLEKAKAVSEERTRLQNTVAELMSKLTEMEHRHEVSCRQLRRDKAQLEQKLAAKENSSTGQNNLENVAATNNDEDVPRQQSMALQITELESLLKSEREKLQKLEQHLKLAEDDTKAVNETWKEQCKELQTDCQEKFCELSKLKETYDKLLATNQEKAKCLEEAEQKCTEIENQLKFSREQLIDTEAHLRESETQSKSLKEDVIRLETELENSREKAATELGSRALEVEKLRKEVDELKQQATCSADSNHKDAEIAENKLREMQTRQQSMEAKHTDAVRSMSSQLATISNELSATQQQIASKLKEIGHLEKEREKEADSRHHLEGVVKDKEAKLSDLKPELDETKETCKTLSKSIEKLQTDLNVAKSAQQAAEDNLSQQQAGVTASKAKLVAAEKELEISNAKLQEKREHEEMLKEQLSTSSQLVKDLEKKLQTTKTELNDISRQFQSCSKTLEAERKEHNVVLKDARANEAVIEKMKLTLREQEDTMLTQERALQTNDMEMEKLKERLAQLESGHEKSESLNEQIRQKNSRIRELEREATKAEKSRQCLEKDVRDTTEELRICERNLTESKKELADAKRELEKLTLEESDVKSTAKQLCQLEIELSSLRKQLEVSQESNNEANEKLATFTTEKEKELNTWREERDTLVASLEKLISNKDEEILRLKNASKSKHRENQAEGKRELDLMQKEVERLSLAVEARDQIIIDLREQHTQLQQQINDSAVTCVEQKTRRSKIPTSKRVVLRVADENADVSLGVLAAGGSAVDLNETITSPKRRTTRRVNANPDHLKISEPVTDLSPRVPRTRRKRTTGLTDPIEATVTEATEDIPPVRCLRSRRF